MPDEPTDEQLLRRFTRGDTAALGSLAQRHEQALLGLAVGLLGARTDLACDAVQDAWVRVIRHGKGFGGKSTFKTWIYRIVINRCNDLRTLKPDRTSENGAARPAPSQPMETAERSVRLHAALEHVPPESRLVLLLCYHQGMTHPQAAEILGIPVGTLKSRLGAALVTLRTHLSSEESRA
jgi:RNA polymerase sigma-70 factor, ECF subfamily